VPVQGAGDTGEATPLLTANNDVQKTEKEHHLKRHVLEYVGMIHCLVVAGIVAWVISEKVRGIDDKPQPEEIVEWKSQLMGYASAIMYGKHFVFTIWTEYRIIALMGHPKWVHVYPKYVSGMTGHQRRVMTER